MRINTDNISEEIKKNASLSVRRKGLGIYESQVDQIRFFCIDDTLIIINVPSQSNSNSYVVSLRNQATKPTITCNCPYDWSGFCKHIVAALHCLENQESILISKKVSKVHEPCIDSTKQWIRLDDLNQQTLDLLKAHSPDNINPPIWGTNIEISNFSPNKVSFSLADRFRNKFKVEFEQQNEDWFRAKCSCTKGNSLICSHGWQVLDKLFHTKDENRFFTQLSDMEKRFSGRIRELGFGKVKEWPQVVRISLSLTGIEVEPLHSGILFPKNLNEVSEALSHIGIGSTAFLEIDKRQNQENLCMGFAFQFYHENYHLISLSFHVIAGKEDRKRETLVSKQKLYEEALAEGLISPKVSEKEEKVFALKALMEPKTITKYLKKSLPDFNSVYNEEEGRQLSNKYLHDLLQQLWPLILDEYVFIWGGGKIRKGSLKQVFPQEKRARITFKLDSQNGLVTLESFLHLNDQKVSLDEVSSGNSLLIQYKHQLFLGDNSDFSTVFRRFQESPILTIGQGNLPALYEQVIQPLSKKFEIEMADNLNLKEKDASLKRLRLYIRELDEYVLFLPAVDYGIKEVDLISRELIFHEENEERVIYRRDAAAEKAFLETLSGIHPLFSGQINRGYFFLDFNEFVSDSWFLEAFETLRDSEVEILGLKDLKKMKFNSNRAKVSVNIKSGIDWFDIDIEVLFGSERVALNEIKKAVQKKENYVTLGDGTLGILPDEWLEKFAAFFRVGKIGKDSLKLSKLHFSVIDLLFDQIDNMEVLSEIHEKRKKLLGFKSIQAQPIPVSITANLRDYQVMGFHWMCFLDDFGWGGCLADDMGLGKTLQAITFLADQLVRYPDRCNLVVVPTSLLFNWEAELNKFAPSLSKLIHQGTKRVKDPKQLSKPNILITTYGTMVRDIEVLSQIDFNYVILDESQAIKNPTSQRFKAVSLLNCRNRIALTGTPIENNTFDLYAQLTFLNPGLFSSRAAFKRDFSNPIDKDGDVETSKMLQKLTQPFVLRRTKDQVAAELPEKVETILFCEMEKEQRKVYDAYKNQIREQLLGEFEEKGLGKSKMQVIQGLMKLRQICDSPAILSDPEDYGGESIKIKELMLNLKEKTGKHKVLVFSQFVRMLSLIKAEVEAEGIEYAYLDGQTRNRKDCVERFQNDPDCKVFLISLKAGGTGLNLTAADYVFIVDPWWNPAAEAQAIDRTHRIGQDKKVFAYKMICKDTIEEKILVLQQKKKLLAQDLIQAEGGLGKDLKQEDILALFD